MDTTTRSARSDVVPVVRLLPDDFGGEFVAEPLQGVDDLGIEIYPMSAWIEMREGSFAAAA